MNTMVACDFFCKSVWTPMGKKIAFVLAFVHLESRRVFASPATFTPNDEWMQQQARNVLIWAEDNEIDLQFLIHDRDSKFSEAFDAMFARPDGGIVRTPFLAPIANCYAESWIGSLKRECLNHLFCFSLGHLDFITQTYVRFHNTVRPHQGLGNIPIPDHIQCQSSTPQPTGPPLAGQIKRQQWLGGLLKHYYRKVA